MSIEGQGHFFTIYFPDLYVLCFTRPRYQVSVYRTIGPLVIGSTKRVSPHSSIVQIIFYFRSFEIMEYILTSQKLSYVKILFLHKFEIFWYFFDLYQSLKRLPC